MDKIQNANIQECEFSLRLISMGNYYWSIDFFFVIVAHLLRVTPNEAIIFTKVENELYGQVQLTNIDLNPVTYKVSFEI